MTLFNIVSIEQIIRTPQKRCVNLYFLDVTFLVYITEPKRVPSRVYLLTKTVRMDIKKWGCLIKMVKKMVKKLKKPLHNSRHNIFLLFYSARTRQCCVGLTPVNFPPCLIFPLAFGIIQDEFPPESVPMATGIASAHQQQNESNHWRCVLCL